MVEYQESLYITRLQLRRVGDFQYKFMGDYCNSGNLQQWCFQEQYYIL